MDFKGIILILFLFPFLLVNCNNDKNQHKRNCIKKDTINIKDVYDVRGFDKSKSFCLSGRMLFPDPCLNNDEAFKIAERTTIFSILEKSDTLYMFSSNNLFSEKLDTNQYLPLINDSTIKFKYSKKYKIIKDPDPPKWTILESEKDTIIMELKSQDYDSDGLLFSIITDTILKFNNGLKIGIDKDQFFKTVGVDFKYDKTDFTIILVSIYESSASWYYPIYCLNHSNKIYCNPDKFHVRSYLKYLLSFKNNHLIKIKIYS